MYTAKTECQACYCHNKGEVKCKIHDISLWYACAALFHPDWCLHITNKLMFATVIKKLVDKIIKTMKKFYQENHQDKLFYRLGEYVEEIERSYMKIK